MRHNREIDKRRRGVFLITSEKLRRARKNKARSSMRCEVEKFARGTDINILEWIVQMESYFEISCLQPKDYVEYMLQKIALPYFKEVVVHKELGYLDFREKLVTVFGEPDFATARLHELKKAEQHAGESIGDFMNRLRLLVMRAHPELGHESRERILVTSFTLGLRDQELATSLTMASVATSAEAERRATEGESARRNARIKNSGYYALTDLMTEAAEQPDDAADEAGAAAGYDEDYSAAFSEHRGGRGGPTGRSGGVGRGRGRGFSTRGGAGSMRGRCYNCGQVGHIRAECPLPQNPATFPKPQAPVAASKNQASAVSCPICRGPHSIRQCPKVAEAPRASGQSNSSTGGP